MSDELKIYAESYDLVLGFFEGDKKKTDLWFFTGNPHLGGASPEHMFEIGRGHKVLRFIQCCLDENKCE